MTNSAENTESRDETGLKDADSIAPIRRHILAQVVPRHRKEGEGDVFAFAGLDTDELTVVVNAEACDVSLELDVVTARKLLTELQREVPELEELLKDADEVIKENSKEAAQQ